MNCISIVTGLQFQINLPFIVMLCIFFSFQFLYLTPSNSVVSCAVPVGNVSWMLFQEGQSSNFS